MKYRVRTARRTPWLSLSTLSFSSGSSLDSKSPSPSSDSEDSSLKKKIENKNVVRTILTTLVPRGETYDDRKRKVPEKRKLLLTNRMRPFLTKDSNPQIVVYKCITNKSTFCFNYKWLECGSLNTYALSDIVKLDWDQTRDQLRERDIRSRWSTC